MKRDGIFLLSYKITRHTLNMCANNHHVHADKLSWGDPLWLTRHYKIQSLTNYYVDNVIIDGTWDSNHGNKKNLNNLTTIHSIFVCRYIYIYTYVCHTLTILGHGSALGPWNLVSPIVVRELPVLSHVIALIKSQCLKRNILQSGLLERLVIILHE